MDGEVRAARVDSVVGNEVVNGVYKERYGKWERRMGESGGRGIGSSSPPSGYRVVERAARKLLCRFQISIKFEKTLVISPLESKGVGVSSEAMMGVRKCS